MMIDLFVKLEKQQIALRYLLAGHVWHGRGESPCNLLSSGGDDDIKHITPIARRADGSLYYGGV